MDAAKPLPDLRAQALAVITQVLKGEPNLSTTLAALGDLQTVQLLLALEEAFAIPLDPDEVLPDGTVAHLLILVQRKVIVGPRLTRPPGEPGCTLYDLAAYRGSLPAWQRRMLGPGAPPPLDLVQQACAEERERLIAEDEGRWPAVPNPAAHLVLTEAAATARSAAGEIGAIAAALKAELDAEEAAHAMRARHPVAELVAGIVALALAGAALLELVTWCLDRLNAVGASL